MSSAMNVNEGLKDFIPAPPFEKKIVKTNEYKIV